MFTSLKKWFTSLGYHPCGEKKKTLLAQFVPVSPEYRMLEIVKGEWPRETMLQYEIRVWSRETHDQSGVPVGHHGHNHWMGERFVQYFCDECDGELTAGPAGPGSTNSVCDTCRINYGTLPLSLER